MQFSHRIYLSFLCFFATILIDSTVFSMPNFARKYKASCESCHTTVPRLNVVGYKFRAAGFRMPNEEASTDLNRKLEDYFSNRTQFTGYFYTYHVSTDDWTTSNKVDFLESSFRLATGSFNKNLSSTAELTVENDGSVNVEAAQMRYILGKENAFLSFRAGIFHPIEGFGASDRSLSISDPTFMSRSATIQSTDALFTILDPSVAGLTLAGIYNDFDISLSLLNRSSLSINDSTASLKYFNSSGGTQMGDALATANYIFDKRAGGSAVSLYYYYGQSQIPENTALFISNPTTEKLYKNEFQKFALFSNYYITSKMNILAGMGHGRDTVPKSVKSEYLHYDNQGYFLAGEYFYNPSLMAGLRLDLFIPDIDVSFKNGNSQSATLYSSWHLTPECLLIGEYKYTAEKFEGSAQIFEQYIQANINLLL